MPHTEISQVESTYGKSIKQLACYLDTSLGVEWVVGGGEYTFF